MKKEKKTGRSRAEGVMGQAKSQSGPASPAINYTTVGKARRRREAPSLTCGL